MLGLLVISVASVVMYRYVPVYITPLMVSRTTGQILVNKSIRFEHRWVPLQAISPELALAVICSEDQNFPNHYGIDIEAITRAVKESANNRKRLRGASTITQQTAKNVFLWPGRSWIRKGMEFYFTLLIELLWNKERILEVYLNSIEMGDGIYGAEAAAEHYFKTSARKLNRHQSAALAAILPNPLKYRVQPQTPYIRARVTWILTQMQHNPHLQPTKW